MVEQSIQQQSITRTLLGIGFVVLGGLGVAAAVTSMITTGPIQCPTAVVPEMIATEDVLIAQSATHQLDRGSARAKGLTTLKTRDTFSRAATARKQWLRELMRRDPNKAVAQVYRKEIQQRLAETTRGCAESALTLRGKAEVMEFFQPGEGEQDLWTMTVDGRTYNIFGLPDSIRAGDIVEVSGYAVDADVVVAALAPGQSSVTVITPAAVTPIVNQHRPMLVLMADFANTDVRTPDLPGMQTVTQALNTYYNENSYGKLQWDITIRDWVETSVNRTTTCDVTSLMQAAIAANDSAVDFRQFAHGDIAVVAPFPSACRWGGMSGVIERGFSTNDGVVNMIPVYVKVPTPTLENVMYVLNHEIGHNLTGSGHANWSRCPDGQIWPNQGCTAAEYEDPYDVMGGWYNPTASEFRFGHFTAERKSWIGWVDPEQVVTLPSGSPSQTIQLTPQEWSGPGVKLIRIQHGAMEYVTLEYRQPKNADGVNDTSDGTMFQSRFPSVFDGVTVRLAIGGVTRLLDVTPQPSDPADVTLKSGQSLTDPVSGSVISIGQITSSGVSVHVTTPNLDFVAPSASWEVLDGVDTDLDDQDLGTTYTGHWAPVIDEGEGVDHYLVGLMTGDGNLFPPQSTTATSISFPSVTLQPGKTYYLVVQAVDHAGNVGPAVQSDGVTISGGSFTTAPPPTVIAGRPYPPDCVFGGSEFGEQRPGNTIDRIALSWCGSPDTLQDIEYQYAVGTSAGSANVVPWTRAGAVLHAVHTGLQLDAQQTYYVSVRSEVTNGVVGAVRTSEPYVIDLQAPPDPGPVQEGVQGDEDISAIVNWWRAHWQPVPDQSKVRYVYGIGTTPGSFNVLSPRSTAITAIDMRYPLPPGMYYTTVRSVDAAGNMSAWVSSDGLRIDPSYDEEPPTISIVTPVDQSTVTGVVEWTATAHDNRSVTSVQWHLDGVPLGTPLTIPPYAVAWNSSTVANGTHTLVVIASDGVHETRSAEVILSADNANNIPSDPPVPALLMPQSEEVVSGTIPLQAVLASGRRGGFTINGVPLHEPQTYSVFLNDMWDTTTVPNGTYWIQALVTDQYGNRGGSMVVAVLVYNQVQLDRNAPSAVNNLSGNDNAQK